MNDSVEEGQVMAQLNQAKAKLTAAEAKMKGLKDNRPLSAKPILKSNPPDLSRLMHIIKEVEAMQRPPVPSLNKLKPLTEQSKQVSTGLMTAKMQSLERIEELFSEQDGLLQRKALNLRNRIDEVIQDKQLLTRENQELVRSIALRRELGSAGETQIADAKKRLAQLQQKLREVQTQCESNRKYKLQLKDKISQSIKEQRKYLRHSVRG